MTTSPINKKIQRFYNANTGLFLKLGHSSGGSIHRAIWGYGVSNREEALHYVDELICRHILKHQSGNTTQHIVDLGCGVAASLCYIAAQVPITGLGITLSKQQSLLGRERIAKHKLQQKLHCMQGNFCKLPENLEKADLAFAIESFVHAESAETFFQQASGLLKPGGQLIICDDFLKDLTVRQNKKALKWIKRFRRGWLIPSLLTPDQVDKYAEQHGLKRTETKDLTEFVKLNRPRDFLIAILMRILNTLALKNRYLQMLYGGHALQICLKKRWICHQFIVLEKI
tara:strand:- start:42711 stop:43565 length:855 start_codon:yes stop_codon:yes gene_type:complete